MAHLVQFKRVLMSCLGDWGKGGAPEPPLVSPLDTRLWYDSRTDQRTRPTRLSLFLWSPRIIPPVPAPPHTMHAPLAFPH